VVATRVGSVAETVADGKTGYLVAPGEAGEVAQRVVELLKDPPRAAAMGRAGRERVIANWSIDRTVEGYQDLIAGIYVAKAQRTPGGKSAGPGDRRQSPTVGRS
jgi:glycosyltransferase involved in cell wall biosynthesis